MECCTKLVNNLARWARRIAAASTPSPRKKARTTGFVMLCRFARVITMLMSVTIWAMSQPVIARMPPTWPHSLFVPVASRGTHPNTSPFLSMAVRTSPAMIGNDTTIRMIFGDICQRFE